MFNCRLSTGSFKRLYAVGVAVALVAYPLHAGETPRFAMNYNILETAAFMGLSKIIAKELTYVPIHADAHIRFNDELGLSVGLVYRYENYHFKGPRRSESGTVIRRSIWTNFHELFFTAGPRFSPFKTGLIGFYVSARAGVGTAFSPDYFCLSAVIQPEVGYTFSFGNPGFNLSLGAGIIANLPLYETTDFAVLFNKDHELGQLPPGAKQPVILTTQDIRRFVRKLIEIEFYEVAVMSYQELSADFKVQPIGRIGLQTETMNNHDDTFEETIDSPFTETAMPN